MLVALAPLQEVVMMGLDCPATKVPRCICIIMHDRKVWLAGEAKTCSVMSEVPLPRRWRQTMWAGFLAKCHRHVMGGWGCDHPLFRPQSYDGVDKIKPSGNWRSGPTKCPHCSPSTRFLKPDSIPVLLPLRSLPRPSEVPPMNLSGYILCIACQTASG